MTSKDTADKAEVVESTGADEFEGGLIPSVPVHSEPEPFVVSPDAEVKVAEIAQLAGDGGSLDAVKSLINQAMAARDAEIQALRTELDTVKAGAGGGGLFDEQASVGGYPWMYWKKPDNWPDEGSRGWISIGPGGPTPKGNRDAGSFNRYLKKGLIPVTRYGYIEPPKEPNALHTFLPILRKGGAGMFPASQVIAFNWHIRPPLPGIIFPAYEAVKSGVINFVCEACGHTMFFMPGETGVAGENYRAHLMTMHKYPFREAAEAVKLAGLTLSDYRKPSPALAGAPTD